MASKTPISILQELVVSKGKPIPNYQFESIGNQLNPEFRCTVSALSIVASETARNKKEAKQKAAAKLLEDIGYLKNISGNSDTYEIASTMSVITDEETKIPIEIEKPTYYTEGTNYVGYLNEYASKNRPISPISYEDSQITSDHFEISCIFGTMKTVGRGRTKKNAKQMAACEMWHQLRETKYKPEACETPKKNEFLDTSSSIAISKYKELTTSSKGVITKNVENTELLDLENEEYTCEEAEKMLKKLDLNYQVETIQTDPYLVVVHADGPVHAMGVGESEYEATEKAMNQTLRKIQTRSLDDSK